MAGKQAKTLTKQQLAVALAKARQGRFPHRDRVIILLSVLAGLRAGEIAGLTWRMVLTADGKVSRQETIDHQPVDRMERMLKPEAGFDAFDGNRDGELDAKDWEIFRAMLAAENGLMAIKLGGSGDMTATAVKWKYLRPVPQVPSTVLYKGVLYMKGSDRQTVFQGVHQMMGADQGRKWQAGEKPSNKMVFIGRKLPKDLFMKGLQQCLA